MKSKLLFVLLLPIFLFSTVEAAPVTLEFTEPITNTDGSQLQDLTTYRSFCSETAGGPYTQVSEEPAPLLIPPPNSTVQMSSVSCHTGNGGTSYFVVRAVNAPGDESVNSNEANKSFPSVAPAAPSDVTALP